MLRLCAAAAAAKRQSSGIVMGVVVLLLGADQLSAGVAGQLMVMVGRRRR